MACPGNSIRYNSTLCACQPGHLLNQSAHHCSLFASNSLITVNSGDTDSYALSFPGTLFAFDSIHRFTQSQAVFLEATLIALLSWLAFCLFLRLIPLQSHSRSLSFTLRWWISRFDICFATSHWLDDQKVVKKRKTELGGTFSVASCILFIGLFAALLYQIISKRTIQVHNVRATNGPELASFLNDMEFNITSISSMSCSNLRDLGTLVTGNPGFMDHSRVTPLSSLANYSCHNTSKGPTISLKCKNCQLVQDNMYISWLFVDLPNNPATTVGFEFNFTAMAHANKKHVSFVSGTLKNGSAFDDRPVTFRGRESNILKFNLFPRIYHNLNGLKLIQPVFHEFLPGSFFRDTNQLQASLESTNDGLINTTLYVNLLSAYVVEIKNQSIMGPVSFLADLGGLSCFSIGIFLYILVQCEYRIKKLRYEDSILQRIRNRQKAQEHWDKLRKYVMYTWGCSALEDLDKIRKPESRCTSFMIQSVHRNGSSNKQRRKSRADPINLNKKPNLPRETSSTYEMLGSKSDGKQNSTTSPQQHYVDVYENTSQPQPEKSSVIDEHFIPPPPSLELKEVSEMNMSDVQKSLKSLYEYNAMLREKLVASHSFLHASSPKSDSRISNET